MYFVASAESRFDPVGRAEVIAGGLGRCLAEQLNAPSSLAVGHNLKRLYADAMNGERLGDVKLELHQADLDRHFGLPHRNYGLRRSATSPRRAPAKTIAAARTQPL